MKSKILAWLFGGRPMQRVEFRFRDFVKGKPVYLWKDYYGRFWLAYHPWDWARVRKLKP